jgi:predicted transposase YbfD/YdcC
VSQFVIALADREPVVPVALPSGGSAGGDPLELFGLVTNGRPGQGRDHPVAALLSLAAAATVAGMKGYTAIAGWVQDVPPPVLADLYLRAGASPARPPSKTTIWRAVTDADAEVFDAMAGRWLMSCQAAREGEGAGGGDPPGLVPVRLDGKTIRGAKDDEGNQRHLLAALAGPHAATSVIAAQAEVGAKTNEVPMAAQVLGQIDLNGTIVTADALHTVKATAEFICEHGGEFVLPVKENRQALFDALDALPWDQVPVACTQTDRGHGRITTRTIQVMPAPEDLPFPHVSQVLLIERYVTGLAGNSLSAVAALGIASPGPDRASPADLAGYVRGQWAIESLHWLRSPGVVRLWHDVAPEGPAGSFRNTPRWVWCSFSSLIRCLAGPDVPHLQHLGPRRTVVDHASTRESRKDARLVQIRTPEKLRDSLYREDQSQVRTRLGTRIMAAMHNLAISALRLAGRTDITEATRWASRSMDRPFTILRLT